MSDAAPPLPLDSVRWRELTIRSGVGAGQVPDALRGLQDGTLGSVVFRRLWPELSSEGTTYDAAYAAAPYLTDIAKGLPRVEAREYLIVLGIIATNAGEVPDDLEAAYRHARHEALGQSLEAIVDCPTGHDLRYLLASVAALRGRPDLASALQDLDAIQDECPACGTVVFPAELQAIVTRDAG